MSDKAVGVKATFSVHGQVVHELESSARPNSPPQPMGVGQQVFVDLPQDNSLLNTWYLVCLLACQ